MNRYFLWAVVVVLSAAAWGTDAVVEGGAYAPRVVAAREADDQLELGWDNGTRRSAMGWYTGAGAWAGNDFNLSTLSTYTAVEKVKFYTSDVWPNAGWDGFRVGIYNFSASVPGSLLWPTAGGGYFFLPAGLHGHVWVEIPIGWTSPSTFLLPAIDQCYNYPNIDPHELDTNQVFRGHSWQYYQGAWSPLEGTAGYRNLMLRVVFDNSTVGVAPASLGRVKALYH